MKKTAIILAITMLPVAAWGWDNRYDNDRLILDSQRNSALQRIADEAQYANDYKVYLEEKRDYEENTPDFIKPAIEHYYRDPQPPTR